eukprot:scaffold11067_cov118-Skeletonema_dohrnii-CCMP3373.AAC.2
MSMKKDGNVMEDMFIAGKLVERKVNGVVEPHPPTIAKDNRDDHTATTASSSTIKKDRIR